MRSAVVYASVGSASAVIAAIAASQAASHGPVRVGELSEMPLSRLEDIELLVVGGPTHLRVGPAAQTGVILDDREVAGDARRLADWLEQLPARVPFPAAAFDTRDLGLRVMTGSGALGIYRALRRHQCHLLSRPMGFLVAPGNSRLLAGEQERATTWATSVARMAEHCRLPTRAHLPAHGPCEP